MADPLSIIGSLLAIVTAGVQSTRSLKEAAERYKTRDSNLRRLLDESADAEGILVALSDMLEAAVLQPALDANIPVASLLRGPVSRCTEVCCKFEKAMEQFSKKSKTGILDWAKMEFMRGDINQFLDTLAGYKATISVGLGVLTMRTVTLSHRALEEYDQLVKNTIYDLQLQLQRIDDKLHRLTISSNVGDSSNSIDLGNERQVTEQCLRICQDAESYFESLAKADAEILQETTEGGLENDVEEKFEAQLLTRRIIDNSQRSLAETIARLRTRLEAVVLEGNPTERVRLQEDIRMSSQCLEVCNMASSEVTNQKIHIIGDVTADGESDHIVVTTLADIFKVGKSISKNKSAMLVGSMSDETLVKLSHNRYHSRFGIANTNDRGTQGDGAAPTFQDSGIKSAPSHRGDETRHRQHKKTPPVPNETRRRRSSSREN